MSETTKFTNATVARMACAVTITDAEELGSTMMKELTELFDKDMDAAWARAASERSALVV